MQRLLQPPDLLVLDIGVVLQYWEDRLYSVLVCLGQFIVPQIRHEVRRRSQIWGLASGKRQRALPAVPALLQR